MPVNKIISVIVPIYNTERYLVKCLDSICNQIFTDFEVIMVDDGSTDNSRNICKEYERADKRFKYFHKENGGSSSARNFGIKIAKGEYIAFVDSDDCIDADYLDTLASYCSEGYDIIQCGMRLVRNGVTTELLPDDAEYRDNEFVKQVLKRDYPIFLLQTTITKFYNRDFLLKSNVVFDENVTQSEDCLFNTLLLPFIRKVKSIHSAKYSYFQDHSFLSKQEYSFEKVWQSIRVGNITAELRNKIINNYHLDNDDTIKKGFQTAVCIIYLSNAREIETGGFSKEEKQRLYDSFFSVMDYPIDLAVDCFKGTDKKIVLACAKKHRKTISRIYKFRNIKKKLIG